MNIYRYFKALVIVRRVAYSKVFAKNYKYAARSNTVGCHKCPCSPINKFLQPSPLLFLPYYTSMPRRALAPISGNIPYRKELTPYNRGVVVGYGLVGVTAP